MKYQIKLVLIILMLSVSLAVAGNALSSSNNQGVSVTAILAPVGDIAQGTVVTPSATVQNFGTKTETFNLTFWIRHECIDLSNCWYKSTKKVVNLEPGTSMTVNFDEWTAERTGDYQTTVSSQERGNRNRSNIRMDGSFQVIDQGCDVGVTAILAPVGEIVEGSTLTPFATAHNFCDHQETFPVVFSIVLNEVRDQIEVYSDTQEVTLPAGDSLDVNFTDWTADEPGAYTTIAYTQSVDDTNPANDTMHGEFVVIEEVNDVGVTAILAPVGSIVEGSTVTPSATVENFGNEEETFPVVFSIVLNEEGAKFSAKSDLTRKGSSLDQTEVYSDTQEVTVPAGDSLDVNFTDWTADEPGAYTTIAYTQSVDDTNPANDTMHGEFEVIEEVHDAGVNAILAPVGSIVEGSTVTPSATVENFGNEAETFNVTFEFEGYTSTKEVADLEPGATTTVLFDDWTADEPGVFTTTAYTQLEEDANPANDTMHGDFEVIEEVNDVGVTAILAPVGEIVEGTIVTPSVTVQNFGDEEETFPVVFSIVFNEEGVKHSVKSELTRQGSLRDQTEVYSDTQEVTVPAGDSLTVNFTDWTADEPGAYTTTAYTLLEEDENPANDTMYGSFEVIEEVHDAGVNAILAPVGSIVEGSTVTPSATVENFGNEAETFNVTFEFEGYTSTKEVADLEPGATTTVLFDDWTADEPGAYTTTAYTQLEEDANPANDTMYGEFVVIEEVNDVGVTAILAPVGEIVEGTIVTPSVTVENFGNEEETFPVVFSIVPNEEGAKFSAKSDLTRKGSSLDQTEVYSDTQEVTVPAGNSLTVNFTDWTADEPGAYTTTAYTQLDDDANPANDTMYGEFDVEEEDHDVGVTEIIEPVGTLSAGDTVTPTIVVENFGGFDEDFFVFFSIGCEYSDFRIIHLDEGETATITFNQWVTVEGHSNENATTRLENDEEPENDGQNAWITVTPMSQNAMGYDTPLNYALFKPSPNPTTNNLSISFALPNPSNVQIMVYDVNGRMVKTLLSEAKAAGTYRINACCRSLQCGTYIAKMKAGTFEAIEKFVVTK